MFQMKYSIETKYLPVGTKRRSGYAMDRVGFLVSHDTGNPGSTALGNVNYYIDSANDQSASAHIFVDDRRIVECVPFLTSAPEKAWHVLYSVTTDNYKYGDDADDIAGGVEYCYGGSINAQEAYKRYIWVLAYSCYKYGLDPATKITGHFILDPDRKTDPKSGLAASLGITFDQLIKDVVNEYNDCITSPQQVKADDVVNEVRYMYSLVPRGDGTAQWALNYLSQVYDIMLSKALVSNNVSVESSKAYEVQNQVNYMYSLIPQGGGTAQWALSYFGQVYDIMKSKGLL